MAPKSTVYRMVEAALEDQGTTFSTLFPQLIEQGKSYTDITIEIRERTSVPLHEATIRRWAKSLELAA